MVRREIDGSKAGYWSSMGREHLGSNKLKGGERRGGEGGEEREERREGEKGGEERGGRGERKGRKGKERGEGRRGEEIRVHVHVYIGHTFHPNLFSSSLLPDNDAAVHSP